MTRDYCDQCKRIINKKNGPVYVSYIHRLGGPMLCLPCFSSEIVWKSLQEQAKKEIVRSIKFNQH